jgi:phosphatidylinositol alpha 1,6-mannosyltransferase
VRVAIVTESFLPTLNGVTTSVLRVSEFLTQRGDEVMVIAPQVPGATDDDLPAGLQVHRVPSLAYREFPVGLPHPMVQTLLAHFQPDVLHAASPFLLGYQALLAAKKLRIPSVAIFQTDVAGFAKRNALGATERFAWWAVANIHNTADLTLVPSQTSKRQLEECGVSQLDHWARGVDLRGFHPEHRRDNSTAAFRRDIAPRGQVVVGYVGRLAPEKNVERLASLRGLDNLHVVVVGDGPSKGSVKKALSGISHTMTGALRGEALHRIYGAFDVFVHTGEEETFGQTLQEAHASGLPVIAPAIGGPLDLVDHGTDGLLFGPGDDVALAHAVGTLRDHGALREQMGEAGRRKVLGRDWASVCSQLVGYYQQVMDSSVADKVDSAGQTRFRSLEHVA